MNRIKQVLITLSQPIKIESWPANFMIAIPRIICGFLLTFDFGASKFGMPWTNAAQELALFEVADWFPKDVEKFGSPFSWAPWFFAWMGASSEAIGGFFLLIGLQTRVFAFLVMCTMLVAIFFQKWGDGVWGMLPAMGFLWMSLYSLVLGSGKFGLDYLISHRMRR